MTANIQPLMQNLMLKGWVGMLDEDEKESLVALVTQGVEHYGAFTGAVIADIVAKFNISPEQAWEVKRWMYDEGSGHVGSDDHYEDGGYGREARRAINTLGGSVSLASAPHSRPPLFHLSTSASTSTSASASALSSASTSASSLPSSRTSLVSGGSYLTPSGLRVTVPGAYGSWPDGWGWSDVWAHLR